MKILIIVPAYNESENIGIAINDLKSQNEDWDILVVNDESKDNTRNIAEAINNIDIINLDVNLGIGGAVQTGFKYAQENNYDIAVQFDGDGQHIASEIKRLITPILRNEADIVVGSRFLDENEIKSTTLSRRIGIKILEILIYSLSKIRIKDATSGFRAFNKESIKFLSKFYPSDYPEPEAIMLLSKKNFRIKEVQVKMKKRGNGKSSIYGIYSIYYMVKVVLSILMISLRSKKNYYDSG